MPQKEQETLHGDWPAIITAMITKYTKERSLHVKVKLTSSYYLYQAVLSTEKETTGEEFERFLSTLPSNMFWHDAAIDKWIKKDLPHFVNINLPSGALTFSEGRRIVEANIENFVNTTHGSFIGFNLILRK